jgi:hypothetical protein
LMTRIILINLPAKRISGNSELSPEQPGLQLLIKKRLQLPQLEAHAMRTRIPLVLLVSFLISACDGWVYVVPTFPAPPPSLTPAILSPTPLFLTRNPSETPQLLTPSQTSEIPTETSTQTLTETSTASPTATVEPLVYDLIVEVLGCKTSFDISHGMGEVTDAFVTLRNKGEDQASDICVTLFALDEGRPHPDKTVCVTELPAGHVVTLKLTVDSTYQQATPIQVEVKNQGNLIARVGQPSCTDIGLALPPSSTLNTPFPIQP